MKTVQNIIIVLLLAVIIGLLTFAVPFSGLGTKKVEEETVSVTLSKVQKVFKFVTVEADISEIYDYKDYHTFNLPAFEKKALIRVNGRASIGYDFDKMNINVDEATKQITITHFPEAEILSLEHDLDYYDITESVFNQFSREDYNTMNANAKKFIENKTLTGAAMQQAKEQKQSLISMIKMLVEPAGWTVNVKGEKPTDILD